MPGTGRCTRLTPCSRRSARPHRPRRERAPRHLPDRASGTFRRCDASNRGRHSRWRPAAAASGECSRTGSSARAPAGEYHAAQVDRLHAETVENRDAGAVARQLAGHQRGMRLDHVTRPLAAGTKEIVDLLAPSLPGPQAQQRLPRQVGCAQRGLGRQGGDHCGQKGLHRVTRNKRVVRQFPLSDGYTGKGDHAQVIQPLPIRDPRCRASADVDRDADVSGDRRRNRASAGATKPCPMRGAVTN